MLWLAICKYDGYVCIFSKFVIEVIADKEKFQMFQTMAALNTYIIFLEGCDVCLN